VDSRDDKTSPLSRYFGPLLHALLRTTERGDVHEANLLTASYEAINVLIQTAAKDMYPLIGQLLPTLMGRLRNTLTSSTESREKHLEVQGLLCAALQNIIQKLDDQVILPLADNLMRLFLEVLNAKSSTVLEEALMAIGGLANRTKASFFKYMPHFKNSLLKGLKATNQQHLCIISTGVVSDISRALEVKLIPFADDIMKALLANLQDGKN